MSDEVENLYLRGLRQIMGELASIKRDVSDVKVRLSSIERGLGEVQVSLGAMNGRIDGVDMRIERLEKQAGLVGGFNESPDPFKGPDA